MSCSQFLTYFIILVLMHRFTESVDDFIALQSLLTIQIKLGTLNKAFIIISCILLQSHVISRGFYKYLINSDKRVRNVGGADIC